MRYSIYQSILSSAMLLAAHAEPGVNFNGSRIDVTLPSSMYANELHPGKYSAYEKTKCVGIFTKSNRRFVGDFCVSENMHFLRDMGVLERSADIDAFSTKEAEEGSLFFASPLSQYEMKPFPKNDSGVKASVVDCDIESAAIYRPTATCHVAVSFIKANRFVYSFFFIKENLSGGDLVRVVDIESSWLSLKENDAEVNEINVR